MSDFEVLRPSLAQRDEVVTQLRGWRLCWDLALAAEHPGELQHLAHTLTAWLRLRASDPSIVPDIVAIGAILASPPSETPPT